VIPVPKAVRVWLAGVEPSVGSVGDSYDNTLAETINSLY
jgi:putative transposase